jgi:hypothetical protein
MGEMRKVYTILVGESQGKKSLATLKYEYI